MNFVNRKACMRWTVAAVAVVLSLLPLGGAHAQDKTYTMKITLATLNDQIHAFVRNYAAAVEKDSGGRIKAEVYPASQLGSIPRQIEGVQFGSIQAAGSFLSQATNSLTPAQVAQAQAQANANNAAANLTNLQISNLTQPIPTAARAPAPAAGRGGRGPRGPMVAAWFIAIKH